MTPKVCLPDFGEQASLGAWRCWLRKDTPGYKSGQRVSLTCTMESASMQDAHDEDTVEHR